MAALHQASEPLPQPLRVQPPWCRSSTRGTRGLYAANSTRLAYIALIFVPLSWAASLFSMAGGYGPGGELFWMYFAIALPSVVLTLMVSAGIYFMDGGSKIRGYGAGS
ncbi:uncharacterized protein PpBr36_10192 [Pyricularia pennisetigena]|uniref:uncharacterized protein n=1 Tax=Pyricularia pennisetigena TaxID=1578925 RepID=UPI00114D6B0F|nr:uncharacterized protein PpBr36_10192 [Pyricularia pennisetigena]TLS21549.1 hypothetical protein PpBr36_10192 [Pyricularia pennisetigena]